MSLLRLSILGLFLVAPGIARAETMGAALTPVRNTTATGQTKPPGRASNTTAQRSLAQRARGDATGNRLSRGICIGCNAR